MKTVRRIVLVLVLLLILILAVWFFLRDKPRAVIQAPPSPPPAANVPKKIFTKKNQAVVDLRHLTIDKWLKNNRTAIGSCLLITERRNVDQVRLMATWNPTGKLAVIRLSPDLGDEARSCLFKLMSVWHLPPAADLSPLSVLKTIRMDLNP